MRFIRNYAGQKTICSLSTFLVETNQNTMGDLGSISKCQVLKDKLANIFYKLQVVYIYSFYLSRVHFLG